jgi:hypothetical protein
VTLSPASGIASHRFGCPPRARRGQQKWSKKCSTGRINGMICLTMALGVAPLRTAARFDVEALIA